MRAWLLNRVGGPDKTILNSPRFLEPYGYRAICAYMHPPGDPGFDTLRGRAVALGARLESIPDRQALDWRVLREMLRLCRRERVAIWHGHDYKSNLLGILLAHFWPMRLITTAHGWVEQTARTPFYYAVDRWALRRYERVICVSEDLFQQCMEAGVPRSACRLIENAIDTEQFSRTADRDEAKRRLGFTLGRILIGAVGRLSGEKGFDRLIAAVDRLLNEGLDLELCIVGEGGERGNLERLIAKLRRQDRIRLAGFQSDTLEWYHAMDVYALSSLREGLPNVLLEAMALKVPVVATRVAGVPKLVRDGENGLLAEADDVEGLCRALRTLASEGALRLRLGEAGRATVEKSYSFAVRMEKIRSIYDELLG
ncbi:MAG TPA: glycosyltransferase [Pirellulales bacterium]|nr:glycosyltransferase [Pirellulales bacterium]